MIEINWNPKPKDLRIFGIIALVATVIISLLLHIIKDTGAPWIFIIIAVGSLIFLCSLISTKTTRIIYLALALMTLPIGWIVSFILLAVFYFLIITPIGLCFRLAGRDPLHRKFDPTAKSYWHIRHPPDKIDRYFHQF